MEVGNNVTLLPGNTLIVPAADESRRVALSARTDSRLLRAVHGPGRGLVTARPRLRRSGA